MPMSLLLTRNNQHGAGMINMTKKEIEAAERTLPRRMHIPWSQWTPEQQRLSHELDCRGMINSCLVYGGIKGFWEEDEWRFGDKSYAAPYIRKLGKKRVEELVAEQMADFEKAVVSYCVYTDDEGLTYNSVRWGDEDD